MEIQALTMGVMAERLGVPIHKAQYLVKSRNIKPIERAGNLRIFDEKAIEKLQRELKRANRDE